MRVIRTQDVNRLCGFFCPMINAMINLYGDQQQFYKYRHGKHIDSTFFVQFANCIDPSSAVQNFKNSRLQCSERKKANEIPILN